MPSLPPHADVVVVGAGISGLTAAYELHRKGIDVIVLEAADRVGGRVLVERTALGSAVDLGGQWIGVGHHRFEALAAELGATQFRMRSPKMPLLADDNGTIRFGSPSTLAAVTALLGFELATHLPGRDTQNTVTLREWLRRVPTSRARRMLEVIIEVTCCGDIDELSVTAFLEFIRYQGGLNTMMKSSGGAQDSLLVEGAGSLACRLADRLGERVHLNRSVGAVDRNGADLVVTTGTTTITADRLVMTVPPPTAARIEFRPALPDSRIRLQDNTYMGAVYKALAVYDTPFWRSRGEAEMILGGETGCAVFDSSPPDGPGHLTVLVGGPDARRIGDLTVDARRTLLLDQLEPHLGIGVRNPASWHDKVWHHDPFVGGGYCTLPASGTREGFYPVAHEPVGTIHWAGTETASEHAGYIEGAIESAHRVVDEIVRSGIGTR